MIGITAAVNAYKVGQALHRFAGREWNAATAAALTRAADTVVGQSGTAMAKRYNLQRWQIIGVGGTSKRSRSGRLARTKPRRSKLSHGSDWNVAIVVRGDHVNPAGTAKRQVKNLKQLKDGTVRAGAHRFPDAWIEPSKYGGKYIRFRGAHGGLPYAKIRIPEADSIVRKITDRRGVAVFERRFIHEIKRRAKRVGMAVF